MTGSGTWEMSTHAVEYNVIGRLNSSRVIVDATKVSVKNFRRA